MGKWYNELILDPADVLCRREQSAIPPIVCSQAGGIGEVEITQQVSARFQLAVPSAVCAVSKKKVTDRQKIEKCVDYNKHLTLIVGSSTVVLDL